MRKLSAEKIDQAIQIPLSVLTTVAYVLVLFGFWRGAYITLLSQPLWFYTSWVNKQKGVFITSIVITIGSIVCILRGLGIINF